MSVYDNCASLRGSLSLQITEVGANYNDLENLPTINGVLLKGDLTTDDLGLDRGYDAQPDPNDPEHLILRT